MPCGDRDSVSKTTTRSTTASRRLTIRQWLGVWKLAFAVGTPTALFTGIVMLFVYLAPKGRLDLLQSAVASPDGLILLVMWAVLVTLSLSVMFFGSLWFIDVAVSIYGHPRRIPKAMSGLLATGSIVWCVLLALIFTLQTPTPYFWLAIFAYFVLMLSLGAEIQSRAYQARRSYARLRFAILGRGASVGLLFAMAALLSLYALLAFLFVEPVFGRQAISFATALLLVGISAPTLILGWAMFRAVAKGREHADVRKMVAFSVLGLTIIGLMCLASPIDERVLQALGVFSTTTERFAVASDDLMPSLKAAGFAVAAESGGAEVFSARVEFRLGDQLVLCVMQAAPSTRGTETGAAKSSKAKSNAPSPSESGKRAGASTIKTAPTLSEQCLDMHSDDVRRLSRHRVSAK